MNDRGTLTPRERRRHHIHERQAAVFGVLIAGLVVVGVGAVGVMSGAISSPLDRPIQSPTLADDQLTTATPCLPGKTRPVSYAKIKVEVYNASDHRGIAKAAAETLGQRGFDVTKVGNSTAQVIAPRIVTGPAGIEEAYTLRAHVPHAKIVLSDRKDSTVQLILGSGFTSFTPADKVSLSPKKAMSNVHGCVKAKSVTPIKDVPVSS